MKIKHALLGLAIVAAFGCDEVASGRGEATARAADAAAPQVTPSVSKAEEPPISLEKVMAARRRAMLPFFATGPVARVNGAEVSAETFNDEVGRMARRVSKIPPGQLEKLRAKVLTNTISAALLEQAMEDAKVLVSEAEAEAEFQKVKIRLEAASPQGMDALYHEAGIDEAKFREELISSLRLRKFAKTQGGAKISNKKAKAFFRENEGQFLDPQGEPKAFSDVKQEVIERLEAREMALAIEALLEKLKAAATIERLTENIEDNPRTAQPYGGHGHPH